MGKKINNSLTRKDGNKLGKRKQKIYSGKHLDSLGVYAMRKLTGMDGNSLNPFYSYVSPQRNVMFSHPNIEKGTHIKRVVVDELDDELSVMADYIHNKVAMDRRFMLPSFADPISDILSIDHGIKAGDMVCFSTIQDTDDMFRNNIMQTAMMYARENIPHVATMCLEIDMEEHMRRINKLCNPKIPVDDDFKWEYKPVLLDEADMELYIEKKHDKNTRLEAIFMQARRCGKSIKLTTPIVKVDAIK